MQVSGIDDVSMVTMGAMMKIKIKIQLYYLLYVPQFSSKSEDIGFF